MRATRCWSPPSLSFARASLSFARAVPDPVRSRVAAAPRAPRRSPSSVRRAHAAVAGDEEVGAALLTGAQSNNAVFREDLPTTRLRRPTAPRLGIAAGGDHPCVYKRKREAVGRTTSPYKEGSDAAKGKKLGSGEARFGGGRAHSELE